VRIALKKEEWLLFLIILAGAILRFYNFTELPLTFDEFSALSRTHFNNFRDLIHYGVVTTDTHPAGVQVFMYYWVKLFGDNSMVVKLPFMIAGVLSIYYAYKIAADWFNPTVGIITALFLAFLQYPIYLTQMARPYASGLLLSILLVRYWSKAFIECPGKCYGQMAGFIIIAALCAYNHYFTLFFAGLVSISGFFVFKRVRLKFYLVSLALSVALYLPHLKIFFIQLAKGGVESWLAKPHPRFFIQYLEFILHFHPLMYIVAATLLLLSFVLMKKNLKKGNKYRWLIFSWILVTYSVSYFYSVYISAVLQYSVLLFTYPFLIMLLFSFIRDIPFKGKAAIVTIFGMVAIFTLVLGREHYSIFYNSGQREILRIAESKHTKLGDNLTILEDMPPNINAYYFEKLNIDPAPFHNIDQMGGYKGVKEFLRKQRSEFLIIGWYDEKQINYLDVALEFYPYIIDKKNWFLCDYYLLSKKVNDIATFKPAERVVFDFKKNYTTGGRDEIIQSNQEYFSLFEGNYTDVISHQYNNLYFTISAELDNLTNDVLAVTEFREGDSIINWRSISFLNFIDTTGVPMDVHEGIKLLDLSLDVEKTQLKVYLWNKNKVRFGLHSFELTVREGNPILYSLYYDFQDRK